MPATATPNLVIGTHRETNDRYTGVLRVGRRIVAECGHIHTNRDNTYPTSGLSARDCMKDIVAAAKRPALAVERATKIRNGWMNPGPWETTAAIVEQLKVRCAANAVAYETLVAEVREMLAQFPAEPPRKLTAPEPVEQEIGEMPDWML
ncbi:hypothetical protein AB0B94_31215 [Micromonospora sp. NPDC048986]|uniref:hypothetical protein n=1 Tax=Micromonospora sp. NPDC048986 TaxID=3155644 RepID=UPI0033DEB30C